MIFRSCSLGLLLVAACSSSHGTAAPATADAGIDSGPLPTTDAGTDNEASTTNPPDAGTPVVTAIQQNITGLQSISVVDGALFLGAPLERLPLPATITDTPTAVSVTDTAPVIAIVATGADAAVWTTTAGFNEAGVGDSGEAHAQDAAFDILVTSDGRIIGSSDSGVYSFDDTLNDAQLLSTTGTPRGLATNASNFVFWADNAGSVFSSADDGSAATAIINGLASPISVAADATFVWVATASSILRLPQTFSADPPPPLAGNLGHPVSLFLDGDYLYWMESDTGNAMRVTKNGGTPQLLRQGTKLSGVRFPRLFGADATNIYWAQPAESAIYKLAK